MKVGVIGLACAKPRDDLARNGFDLRHVVFVRNEDQLLRSDRDVRLERRDRRLPARTTEVLGRGAGELQLWPSPDSNRDAREGGGF